MDLDFVRYDRVMSIPWGPLLFMGVLALVVIVAAYLVALRWSTRPIVPKATPKGLRVEVSTARVVGRDVDVQDGLLLVLGSSVKLIEQGHVVWSADTSEVVAESRRSPRPSLELWGGRPVSGGVTEPFQVIVDSASPVPVIAGRIGLARQNSVAQSIERILAGIGVRPGEEPSPVPAILDGRAAHEGGAVDLGEDELGVDDPSGSETYASIYGRAPDASTDLSAVAFDPPRDWDGDSDDDRTYELDRDSTNEFPYPGTEVSSSFTDDEMLDDNDRIGDAFEHDSLDDGDVEEEGERALSSDRQTVEFAALAEEE